MRFIIISRRARSRSSSRRRPAALISPLLPLLLLLLLLSLLPVGVDAADLAPPAFEWADLKPEGTFTWAWTVEKSVDGLETGATANVRLEKGATRDVTYRINVGRTVDDSTVKMTLSGALTIKNADPTSPIDVLSAALKVGAAPDGAASASEVAGVVCSPALPATLAPGGGAARCTWAKAAYLAYPSPAAVAAVVKYRNSTTADEPSEATAASPEVSFAAIEGQFATALLTDKTDLAPLDRIYTGFSNFNRDTVWRAAPGSTLVPSAGETLTGPTVREFTVRLGSFIVCTGSDGVTVTNTATVSPQQSGTTGVQKLSTARLVLAITGCDRPPDVNFQDLASWGAVNFGWSVAHRPVRPTFSVQADAGSVPVEFTVAPAATAGTGSYAVSGAVFINNVQPGLLNIERLVVQLSSGQQAFPTCALNNPVVGSDGSVWGGVNSGGSLTTYPIYTGSVIAAALGGVSGSWNRFLLPEFASATCRFNISLGSSYPGGTVTVTPMLNWGFGGMYMLNQPPTMQVSFRPLDHFFPVGRCASISTSATSGGGGGGSGLQLTNNGPQQQQACIEGDTEPYTQPAPIQYTVAAAITPATTLDCGAVLGGGGAQKTFTVSATATATPLGTASGSSPITAVAEPAVQITVTCPPSSSSTSTSSVSLQQTEPANLKVSVGSFQTYVQPEYSWTVEKVVTGISGDGAVVSDPPSAAAEVRVGVDELPRTVSYRVRVSRSADPVDARRYVAGRITVLNAGAKSVGVDAVYVTAGPAVVRANCPEGTVTAEPNVNLVCTFNVTWNRGPVPGSLGARVETPEGEFVGEPAGFGWEAVVRGPVRGERASLFDELVASPPPNVMPPAAPWYSRGDTVVPARAEGVTLTADGDREYEYSIQLGPFSTRSACGNYTLSNTVSAEPAGAPTSAATATAVVSVAVTGCPEGGGGAQLQSAAAADASVAVEGEVEVAKVSGVAWTVATAATPAALEVPYGETGAATFTAKFGKAATAEYRVSGAVLVGNAAAGRAVDVARVRVAVAPAGRGARAVEVDAVCGGGRSAAPFTIAVDDSEMCTFTATLDAAAMGDAKGGDVVPTVFTADGASADGDRVPFTVEGAEERVAPDAADCARALSGSVVGVPLWAADGGVKARQTEERVCETRTASVPVTVGPFGPSQCGSYVVTSLAALQPLLPSSSRALPMVSSATPLTVTVTGCPPPPPAGGGGGGGGGDDSTPSPPPQPSAGPSVTAGPTRVRVLEAFSWSAKLSADAAGGLVTVRRGAAPAPVSFIADAARSEAGRSAAIDGSVRLEAPAGAEKGLRLKSASVAIYDGSGPSYKSAPLDCGAASAVPGGAVDLPPRGTPVECTYEASGLAAADGLVLPIIVVDGGDGGDGSASPYPSAAAPVAYETGPAPREGAGRCADVGMSFSLTAAPQEGGAAPKRASWQPAFAGQAMGSGPDCEGGSTRRFEVVFGGDAEGRPVDVPCGDYEFEATMAVVPQQGAGEGGGGAAGEAVTADSRFAVKVEGCR